ncbi:hypothetical protein BH24ACI3_BH24ACI3_13020 [soil metagenome]
MVLLMIGILTAIAVIQLGSSKVDLQRQRLAREFKIYLERARFDSVKRRPDLESQKARVVLNGPSTFTAHIDFDGDGNLQASELKQIDFRDRTDAHINVSDAWTYPITVAFDRKGHVTTTDGTGSAVVPLFTICSDCSDASPNITRISVSSSGTVAEIRRGQNPQALPTPVLGTTSIPLPNCYVLAGNTTWTSCQEY